MLWLAEGLLLVITGVMVALYPDAALRVVSVFLGLALLVAGAAETLVSLVFRGRMFGLGGVLVNGIITLLLGCLVLFNRWITVVAAPVLFSAWILLTGVSTLVRAVDLRHFQVRGWLVFLLLGLAHLVLGVAALFQPMTAVRVVGLLAGLQLALRGVDALLGALFFDSFYL